MLSGRVGLFDESDEGPDISESENKERHVII